MPNSLPPSLSSNTTITQELGTASIDPLEELFVEVNTLALKLQQEARRGQTADDLPAGGNSVLRTLSKFGALTVPQIARLNSTSRQNVQIIVNRLAREECIEFMPNPAHKRSELVRLTNRGQASVEALTRNEEGYKKRLLPHVTTEDLHCALKLLRSIRDVLMALAPSPAKIVARRQTPRLNTTFSSRRGPSTEIGKRKPKPERIEETKMAFETDELPVNLL